MQQHIWEVGEAVTLTPTDGSGAIVVLASQIFEVTTNGSGSNVSYLKNGRSETVIATESRATVATAAGNLVEITPASTGVAKHIGINGIQNIFTHTAGAAIVYFATGINPIVIPVTESVATLKTAINAAAPGGNFVTLDTDQTITGQKTFDDLILYSQSQAVTAAGTVQGDATALTAEINNVTSSTNNTQLEGVVLMATSAGARVVVANNRPQAGASLDPITIYVYPATGEDVGAGTNNPIALPTGWTAIFDASATGWSVEFSQQRPLTTLGGVSAFATGGQGSATVLLATYAVVTGVATDGDSVKLRPLVEYATGQNIVVVNEGAGYMDVFPAVGEDIGAGTNTAIPVPVGGILYLQKISGSITKSITPLALSVGDGAVATPSITFNSDPTSGWYRVSATQYGFSVAGTLMFLVDSTGISTAQITEQVIGAGVAFDGTGGISMAGIGNVPAYRAVAPQEITGPSALSTTIYASLLTTSGADAYTLADGSIQGQIKKVRLVANGGGDATLTLTGFTSIVYTTANDATVLQWDGAAWVVIDFDGTPTITP